MMEINKLLGITMKRHASDLHLVVPNPPILRIAGELTLLDEWPSLTPEISASVFQSITSETQQQVFERELELDFSLEVPGVSRFRVNASRQRDSISLVFRPIPSEIPTIEELGLPELCKNLVHLPKGLILVTGPTGCGKSTTLAAMIDYLNGTAQEKIVTIEDPIEFLYPNKKCIISQRHLGSDTNSFASALRHVLRQDPNVIMIGEMRDLETISAALTAAETGHLILSTLHTRGAAESVSRIIDVFPAVQQGLIRIQLANVIEAIISQVLLRRVDGRGRVAAFEVMLGTDAIRNLIRENKPNQIPNFIGTGRSLGMRTLEQDLERLRAAAMVTDEEVLSVTQVAKEAGTKPGKGGILGRNWSGWMTDLSKAKGKESIQDQGRMPPVASRAGEIDSAKSSQQILKLRVVPPVDSDQIRKFEEQLKQVQDIRVLLVSGSAGGNFEIVVSTRKSLPVIDVLREVPLVERVAKKDDKIMLRLKAENY